MNNPKRHWQTQAGLIIPELRAEFEIRQRYLILKAIEKHKGFKKRAALELGIKRSTLACWVKRNHPELMKKPTRIRTKKLDNA